MMMAKIFWDTILLISGTFSISLVLNGSLFTFGAGRNNSTLNDANIFFESNSTAFPYFSTNGSFPTNQTATIATSTTGTPPIKKLVAAAVRSHFDDCPDSHRHFCFHGTCRFLILEETPACVCHQGFVGIRCEHADLLAVVATNQSQNTITTVLVFCVIGCVFIAVLVTLLHCWWRQLCRRRRLAHHYASEKNGNGVSYWPSESDRKKGSKTFKWFETTLLCWVLIGLDLVFGFLGVLDPQNFKPSSSEEEMQQDYRSWIQLTNSTREDVFHVYTISGNVYNNQRLSIPKIEKLCLVSG